MFPSFLPTLLALFLMFTSQAVPALGPGSSGTTVAVVQSALGVTADGAFGPATERAVEQLQRQAGLPVDGLVGPLTLAVLLRADLSHVLLTNGAKGPLVVLVQKRLAQEGFAPGTADGLYGPKTREAIRRFQAANGLAVDGMAGPITLARLFDPELTVPDGATLDGLAARFDLTPTAIATVNGLSSSFLQAGQVLRIPLLDPTVATSATSLPAVAPTASATAPTAKAPAPSSPPTPGSLIPASALPRFSWQGAATPNVALAILLDHSGPPPLLSVPYTLFVTQAPLAPLPLEVEVAARGPLPAQRIARALRHLGLQPHYLLPLDRGRWPFSTGLRPLLGVSVLTAPRLQDFVGGETVVLADEPRALSAFRHLLPTLLRQGYHFVPVRQLYERP